jgi:hypothetical protein
MADDKPKFEFKMPDADKRKALLEEYLPAFIKQYQDELPEEFLKSALKLVQITTDKPAFAEYVLQDKNPHKLHQACEFISEKTGGTKTRAAREIQDQLINGLMRRWKTNVAKFRQENDPMEDATEGVEGKFILEMMSHLLENNIRLWLFQAKRKDDRIENIDVEDLRGEAHRLMVRRVFMYNDEKSHLKTYLEIAFGHFGQWCVDKKEVTEEKLFGSFDIQNDKGNTLDFAARLVDTREALPEENAHQQKIIEAVQTVIENLEVGDTTYKNRKYNVSYKDIMQIYMLGGKEGAYELMEREYGIKILVGWRYILLQQKMPLRGLQKKIQCFAMLYT